MNDELLTPGRRLDDRFELVRHVGTGAMGEVWLAKDTALDSAAVACKILRREWAESRPALADLKREILLARRLRHPHILPLYTYRDDGHFQFVTMEFAEGESLATALKTRGIAFEATTVARWTRELAMALDYAHTEGVLHRDVKPDNVLLGRDERVVLADFGIARTVADLGRFEEQVTSQGTLHYISPEQLTGRAIDGRSDLYSLAATVYTLTAGRPPFHGESLIADIQMKVPPPVEHLPDNANAVLRRALAKVPALRYPSCGEFARAFAETVTGVVTREEAVPVTVDPSADTVALPPEELHLPHVRFGQLLLDSGTITEDQLRRALVAQHTSGKRLGEELTSGGALTENQIATVVAKQLGLRHRDATAATVDLPLVAVIGRATLSALGCLPLVGAGGDPVFLAMSDPLDLAAINRVEERLNRRVAPVVSTWSALRDAAYELGLTRFGHA